MRTRFLALLFILLFVGCLKDDTPTDKVVIENNQNNQGYFIYLEDLVNFRSGPQGILGTQNMVYDNMLEVTPTNKREFIFVNLFLMRNGTKVPSLPFEEANVGIERCGTYNVIVNWKDNDIPLVFTRDLSKYTGTTTTTFIPNISFNNLQNGGAVKALKYVLIGMTTTQVTHNFGTHKVQKGIFQKYYYDKGKWVFLETKEIEPNNKGGMFNLPVLF